MSPTPTAEMPLPETYEDGLAYWSYDVLLEAALNGIVRLVPKHGTLIDMMCGPGYLLGKIAEKRPDLILLGVDLDARYVEFGNRKYPKIFFTKGDILSWRPPGGRVDAVVCTGALHHVPYEQQDRAVGNIASMLKPGGVAIISDVYIADYNTEDERKRGAAELGCAYLKYAHAKGAPPHVMQWTREILFNDLAKREYKTSFVKRLSVLDKHFPKGVEHMQTWPDRAALYSERLHVCHV